MSLVLKSTEQTVIDSGLRNDSGYKGIFIPTPRKNKNRPQNHLQYVHPSKLKKIIDK